MKTQTNRLTFFAVFFLGAAVLFAQRKPQEIVLQSKADTTLIDQPFVLKRAQLKPQKNLLPALCDNKGKWIPSQVDDLDRDGRWDELAFLCTLAKGEKKTLTIKWVSEANYPSFTRRANVRYGKLTASGVVTELKMDSHGKENLSRGGGSVPYPYQMDGVAWENDRMGFRHYFDGRNCRDVYGKKTTEMVLDKVGIKPDGYPGDTYHVMADWGRDILSVGKSFGMGGLALLKNEKLIRLGVTVDKTTDNVDSTRYTLINKGVVRALFRLDFFGWDVDGEKIDLSQVVTIWGGSYGYENRVIAKKLPKGSSLVTGIVRNNNNQPLQSELFYGNRLMLTHDKQTYNKEFTLGLGLIVPASCFGKSFDTPDQGDGILYTWCAQLQPDKKGETTFSVLAAWEMQNPAFLNRDFFVKTLKYEALKRSNTVTVTLK